MPYFRVGYAPLPAHIRRGALPALVLVSEVAIAVLSATRPGSAIVACLAIGACLLLLRPGSLIALAPAACFIASRIGGGSVDLSVADAFLALATVGCLYHLRNSPLFRRVTVVAFTYVLMLGVVILASTTKAGVFEWLHRSVILLGSISVGAAIMQAGRVRFALRTLFTVAALFSVAAVLATLASGFQPAYPFGYHKNFVGPLLAMCAIAVLAARRTAGIPSPIHALLFTTYAAGLLATQSRASMLGLAAGLAVLALRTGGRSAGRLLVVGAVSLSLLIAAFFSIRAATTGANNTQFNTVRSREAVYRLAFQLFREHPLFGAGLRWFKLGGPSRTAFGEPHSAVYVTLSESGVWGLIAVIVLFGGVLAALRRHRHEMASLAIAVIAFRLVEGQFAIFWIAGTMTLPWLFVGMACSVAEEPLPFEAPNQVATSDTSAALYTRSG